MGGCLYCGGLKSFLFYIGIVCILGWLSVLQTLQSTAGTVNYCPSVQQRLEQEWRNQGGSAAVKPPVVPSEQHDMHVFNPHHKDKSKRRLRVLLGIFTFDSTAQLPYRRQYRKLFEVFPMYNDTRVCSLHDFEAMSEDVRYSCQLIYTFVVGGLKDEPNARTELVDESSAPIILDKTPDNIRTIDLKENEDVTYLNIKENMNEGKSQTWFKYASLVMDQYDLDYAGKIDSDSLPYLDKFFSYAYSNLPPPPYNNGVLVGVPIDKLWWQRTKAEMHQDSNEDFFRNAYGKIMHLYAAGQCYLMSKDLAKGVALEAPNSDSYREGHEDHDISAMAFHSKNPINFHFLTLQQQFWKHPVKRFKKKVRMWRTLWHNENIRMKKVLELQHRQETEEEEPQIPNELAAPVQQELDGKEEGEEEEDTNVDADNNSSGKGEDEEEDEDETLGNGENVFPKFEEAVNWNFLEK